MAEISSRAFSIALGVGGGDLDGAVVVDVDLGARLLDDRADDLAARADDFADLVDGDLHGLDARGVGGELAAARGQRLAHLVEDVQPAVLGLRQRLLHDLGRDAGDLDVHLQRGDAVRGAGDLEVHVAEVVLVAEDVGQHGELLALEDQAHGDARDRRLERHAASIIESDPPQTVAIEEEPFELGDLRDDADGVGEVGRGGQHRLQRAPGELAVADLAAARAAHAAGSRRPSRAGSCSAAGSSSGTCRAARRSSARRRRCRAWRPPAPGSRRG